MIDYLAELGSTDLLLEAIREAERVLPQRGEAVRREDEALPAAAKAPGRGGVEEMVRLPLLEAVESAERRAVWTAAAPEQRDRERGVSARREEVTRRERQPRERGQGMSPGESLTLRQVGRAIQRDERRYDGGFFLY